MYNLALVSFEHIYWPTTKGSMASERGMVCEIDRIGKTRLVDIHAAGFGFGLVLVIS